MSQVNAQVNVVQRSRPLIDLKSHQHYRNAPSLPFDENVVSRHLARPTDFSICFICCQKISPEKDQFNTAMGTFDLRDRLTSCAFNGCPHKFHFSCMSTYRGTARFLAQYLALECNYGAILCPDHYCETCHADFFQLSAARGEDFVFVKDQVRAYHVCCEPPSISSEINPITNKREIVLQKRYRYKGKRGAPVCAHCGAVDTSKELRNCHTCVNRYHYACENIKPTGQYGICEDCIFDIQIRKTDNVLIEKRGFFVAVHMEKDAFRTITEGKKKIIEVKIRYANCPNSLRSINEKWVALNSLYRPYPRQANAVFTALKALSETEERKTELSFLVTHLQERFNFKPVHFKRPLPRFQSKYLLHSSITNRFQEHVTLPNVSDCHKNIKVVWSEEKKWYGVFAERDLPCNTILGYYTGELISLEENLRRRQLGADSNDVEKKYYYYETNVTYGGRTEVCYIDASKHQNKMSMINSSCAPNCRVHLEGKWLNKPEGENEQNLQPENQKIKVSYVKIVTIDEIEKGQEILLNYKWTTECYCGNETCKRKPPVLNWDLPVAENLVEMDGEQNENVDPMDTS